MRRFIGAASNLVQFFPLSVFATYAFWYGVPTSGRWVEAFKLAALAGVIQLGILLLQRRPINRLILGANLYLVVGGAAALAHHWWLLEAYGVLREAGIFLFMLGVGVVTTFATPAGFVAVADAPRPDVRRSSLWLLAATLIAVVIALVFRGHRLWAAVVPVIALAAMQRVLVARLRYRAKPDEASPSVRPGGVRTLQRVAFAVALAAIGVVASRALVGTIESRASASGTRPTYDETDLARVDYRGLPAPTMLAARDGTPLAARIYAGASDTVVVAIHGSTGNGRYYHPMARYLSEHGPATVYAVDLRGHGESGGRRGDVDYIGQLEDDLADTVTAVRRERPAARIVVLGHSAGGGLIVRYAGSGRGPAVDGYVLLSPYLGADAPTTKADAGGWARPDVPKIIELSSSAARGDTSGQDAIVLRFNQPAASASPLQVLAYSFRMMASFTPRRDLARELAAIRRPLLVLAGERDESFRARLYESTISPHLTGMGGPDMAPQTPQRSSRPGQAGPRLEHTPRATFTVLADLSHLGLVVNRRTAEEIGAWLARLP